MRRYTILLLTAFLLILSCAAGMTIPVGADQNNRSVPLQELTAYTTLPPEHAALLSEAYERENHVRVNFVPLAPNELLQQLQDDAVSDPTVVTTSDIVLADSDVLNRAAELNLLKLYVSETNDAVKPVFKNEDGAWTGVWYDPVVFCINRDFLQTLRDIPDTWTSLADSGNIRVGITDFLAADASANLMYQMIGQFGDAAAYDILDRLHPKVIQYAKYLSNPVRQAGMGEVDISIAVESETIRYLQNGYPLKIIYPADGTAFMLTGVAISSIDDGRLGAAAEFSDWLLSDEAQLVLQKNDFYFVPTNPQTLAYKKFAGKNLRLFDVRQSPNEQQRYQFLDRWVKQIRLKETAEGVIQ